MMFGGPFPVDQFGVQLLGERVRGSKVDCYVVKCHWVAHSWKLVSKLMGRYRYLYSTSMGVVK